MALMYEVTGYDPATGRLKASYDVPAHRVGWVKSVAGVAPSDDGLGSYPLGGEQIAEISRGLEIEVDCGLDFFLEPYEAPRQAAR